MNKTVTVQTNTEVDSSIKIEFKSFNNVETIDLKDTSIFLIKYRDEKGKKATAIFNRPVDIQPNMAYATRVIIEFTP